MDLPSPPSVSRSFGSRVKYEWVFEDPAWREHRYENGRLREPAERVDLRRVLAKLRDPSFQKDQALRIDAAGAERLGLSPSR